MEIIYQNFDTIEISFQCAISGYVLKQLERAKKEAQSIKNSFYAEIGQNKLPVMVGETGAKGGYTYQFSTGHDGHIWLIGDRDNRTHWNVRVKVRSLCLALYGYEATKVKILDILDNDLRAKGPDDNFGIPVERISRFDYCVDFILEDKFQPKYEDFVCACRTKKSQIGDLPYKQVSTGDHIDTLMIGKMPNKQITIYNKTKEIIASKKSYWWDIWEINKKEFNKTIWRVEIRAGKKELNKWNLRKFEDFEQIVGNVINKILNDYKHTKPNKNDLNRTRWPISTIWINIIKAIKKDLFKYTDKENAPIILNKIKTELIECYKKQIQGLLTGYNAATGRDISEIPGVLEQFCGDFLEEISQNPNKFIQKHDKKVKEFTFLNKEKQKSGN